MGLQSGWWATRKHAYCSLDPRSVFNKVLVEASDDADISVPDMLPSELPAAEEIIRAGLRRWSVAWWHRHARAVFLCKTKDDLARIVAPGFIEEHHAIATEGDLALVALWYLSRFGVAHAPRAAHAKR